MPPSSRSHSRFRSQQPSGHGIKSPVLRNLTHSRHPCRGFPACWLVGPEPRLHVEEKTAQSERAITGWAIVLIRSPAPYLSLILISISAFAPLFVAFLSLLSMESNPQEAPKRATEFVLVVMRRYRAWDHRTFFLSLPRTPHGIETGITGIN
jgi:hypothetical protein